MGRQNFFFTSSFGAGLRRRSASLLYRSNFSATALGAGTITDPSLTFARSSGGGSVQTSASTLSITGLTNDVPRFGSNGTARGLLVEVGRTNRAPDSRNLGSGNWATTGTRTSGQPDAAGGNSAYRLQCASGGYGAAESGVDATASSQVWSAWYKSASGTAAPGQNVFLSSVAGRSCNNATIGTTWGRLSFSAADASGCAMGVVDGRDFSGFGGLAAGARDFYADFVQHEIGTYPTEVIVTAGATATRAGERLSVASASVASVGRIEFELDVYAKGAATEYAGDGAYVYLLYVDASNFVRLDTATRRLEVRVAASTWSPVTALTWARSDRVTFRVAAGGGSLVSRASYSVNGAAYTSLGTNAAQGTWAAGNADVCSLGTASQFSCWLSAFTFYAPGGMP